MVFPGHGIAWKDFWKAFKTEWKKDKLTDVGGSLVFFGILALAPFLIFLVTLAGLIIKPDQIEQIVNQLAQVAPKDAVKILSDQIRDIHKSSNAGLLTVGFIAAIWSASGGMASLMAAFNGVYDVEEGRPFWKKRGIAILMTLGVGALTLVATLIGIAAAPLAAHLPAPFDTLVTWLRIPVAGLLMIFAWACLYYFLPDVEQEFKFITPGSVFGVLMWMLASWGFSIYVTKFGSYNKTYGALGGVIVMLMWMWISSIVLLIGAEINAICEQLSPEGKRRGAKSMADKGPSLPKGLDPSEDDDKRGGKPIYVPVPAVQVRQQVYAPRKTAAAGPALMGLALTWLLGGRKRRA